MRLARYLYHAWPGTWALTDPPARRKMLRYYVLRLWNDGRWNAALAICPEIREELMHR